MIAQLPHTLEIVVVVCRDFFVIQFHAEGRGFAQDEPAAHALTGQDVPVHGKEQQMGKGRTGPLGGLPYADREMDRGTALLAADRGWGYVSQDRPGDKHHPVQTRCHIPQGVARGNSPPVLCSCPR